MSAWSSASPTCMQARNLYGSPANHIDAAAPRSDRKSRLNKPATALAAYSVVTALFSFPDPDAARGRATRQTRATRGAPTRK